MGIWLSIRNFYRRWKPEIDIYGLGFLLMGSALITGRFGAAVIILVIMLMMDAMRRWGEPYRQLGEQEMERRRLANQQFWRERTADFLSRFQKDPDDAPPPASRVIPNPQRLPPATDADEPPPESPAPIVASEPPPPTAPIPPVTHET